MEEDTPGMGGMDSNENLNSSYMGKALAAVFYLVDNVPGTLLFHSKFALGWVLNGPT